MVIVAFLNTSYFGIAQSKRKMNKETTEWRYEAEANGTGTQGTYQLKVWTYARKGEKAINQAKKNAVHAVLFKGFPNNGRIQGQKPLISKPNTEEDEAEFFTEFFKDGGEFQKYVFLVNNGAIGPGDRIKVSKKEYKIGVVVSVNAAGLRKELENKEIIQALSSGF